MQLSIHHVAIICSDIEAAKRFYVDLLGFRVIKETHREERGSWKVDLDIDGRSQIELFTFPSPPPRVSGPEACGLRHLAFRVKDLDETVARAAASGVAAEPVRIDPITGKRFTFIKDPDGLPIEFYEEQE